MKRLSSFNDLSPIERAVCRALAQVSGVGLTASELAMLIYPLAKDEFQAEAEILAILFRLHRTYVPLTPNRVVRPQRWASGDICWLINADGFEEDLVNDFSKEED